MMITTSEIVVIMLLALFFLSCNCREMPIEGPVRKWSLHPAVFGRRDCGVSQDSSVLASYDNLEAIAKPRGGNDHERRFIEPPGEENTAGTPEVHLSLKRRLFIVSGKRLSMNMGYQDNFSGATPMHKQFRDSVKKGFYSFSSKKTNESAELKYDNPSTFHVDYSGPKSHPPKNN